MAAITMRNIVKQYGDGFPAVNDVSLDIADGEFMILVGPSGCGKSTLLRMIVGLEDITSGDMLIDGNRVNDKAPRDRNLAMVFQNYALYPHLNVFENIAFPLRLQGHARRRDQDPGARRPPRRSSSPSTSTASRRTCPAASASGSPWAGPSSGRPTRSSSTSRCPTSTRSCAARCAPRSCACSAGSAHHRVRHPRPDRGDDPRRPRRGAAQGPAPAGRHTPRAVRAPRPTCSSPGSSGRRR